MPISCASMEFRTAGTLELSVSANSRVACDCGTTTDITIPMAHCVRVYGFFETCAEASYPVKVHCA